MTTCQSDTGQHDVHLPHLQSAPVLAVKGKMMPTNSIRNRVFGLERLEERRVLAAMAEIPVAEALTIAVDLDRQEPTIEELAYDQLADHLNQLGFTAGQLPRLADRVTYQDPAMLQTALVDQLSELWSGRFGKRVDVVQNVRLPNLQADRAMPSMSFESLDSSVTSESFSNAFSASIGDLLGEEFSDSHSRFIVLSESIVVVSSENAISFVDFSDPAAVKISAQIAASSTNNRLLVHDDRLIVIGERLQHTRFNSNGNSLESPTDRDSTIHSVEIFDISDLTQPRSLSQMQFTGQIQSASVINNRLVITQSVERWVDDLFPPQIIQNGDSFPRFETLTEYRNRIQQVNLSGIFQSAVGASEGLGSAASAVSLGDRTELLRSTHVSVIDFSDQVAPSVNTFSLAGHAPDSVMIVDDAVVLSRTYRVFVPGGMRIDGADLFEVGDSWSTRTELLAIDPQTLQLQATGELKGYLVSDDSWSFHDGTFWFVHHPEEAFEFAGSQSGPWESLTPPIRLSSFQIVDGSLVRTGTLSNIAPDNMLSNVERFGNALAIGTHSVHRPFNQDFSVGSYQDHEVHWIDLSNPANPAALLSQDADKLDALTDIKYLQAYDESHALTIRVDTRGDQSYLEVNVLSVDGDSGPTVLASWSESISLPVENSRYLEFDRDAVRLNPVTSQLILNVERLFQPHGIAPRTISEGQLHVIDLNPTPSSDGSIQFDPKSELVKSSAKEDNGLPFVHGNLMLQVQSDQMSIYPLDGSDSPQTIKLELDWSTIVSTTDNQAPDQGNDDPGSDDPGSDDPGSDDPGSDDPGSDDPGSDDPGSDDPGSDDPGSDDPGSDDPGSDDPGSDDPGSDDPGSDDPGSGDPGSGDPGSGDPGSGDPGSGDPGSDDPGSDDPGSDDPGSDDPGSDDPDNDDSGSDDAGADDSTDVDSQGQPDDSGADDDVPPGDMLILEDIDGDGQLLPRDVLMLIQLINGRTNTGDLMTQEAHDLEVQAHPGYDVSGDGRITARDVLLVIQAVNAAIANGTAGSGT